MRPIFATVAIVALLAANLRADEDQLRTATKPKAEHTSCHGTTVEFVATPVEAAKLAAEQKKLVFVLHVSGYFEDPNLT